MSTEIETPILENIPATSQTEPNPPHRKIAKLPKPLRDLINSMLDDGLPAREIIARLQQSTDPVLPYPISEMNISDWRNGGYQDYLRQQQWRDDSRFLLESASDIPEFNKGPQLQQTLIQLALVDIFRALKDGTVQPDSPNYIRLFNALARLNREALSLRKYADANTRAETAELKKLNPDRDLDDNELLMLVNRMDKVFHMPRPNLDQLLAKAALKEYEANQRTADLGKLNFGPGPHQCSQPIADSDSPKPDPIASPSEVGHVREAELRSPCAPLSSIEHPASGIENLEICASVPSCDTPTSQIANQNSKIVNSPVESINPLPIDSALRTPNSALEPSINPVPVPASPFANQNSKIQNPPPPEFCPECQALLRPRLPTGERPGPHCHVHGCGSPVRPNNAPFESCPHCGVTVPDLLPNGLRPVPSCPECKKPLPPPDQVPLLAEYLKSLTGPKTAG